MKKTTLKLLSIACALLIAGTLMDFSLNSNKVYADTGITVTYDGNGADGGAAPVDSNTYNAGDDISVETIGTLSKTGYIFTGWNTLAEGTGTVYTPNASIAVTGSMSDFTLYATWSQVIAEEPTKDNDYKLVVDDAYSKDNGYTVYYQWCREDGEPYYVQYEYDNYTKLPLESTFANTSYYCVITVTKQGGLNTSCRSVSIETKEIKFDVNDATEIDYLPDPVYQPEGREVSMAGDTFTKENYRFIGWSTDKNATTATHGFGGYIVGNEDVTFYAVWQKIIKEEPSKDNGYTVSLNDEIVDYFNQPEWKLIGASVSYQWYKIEHKWSVSSVYYANYSNGGNRDDGTAPLANSFYLEPGDEVTSLRFKYTGDATITSCTKSTDGYYYPACNPENGRYEITSENGNGELISDIEVYGPVYTPIAGQTSAALNLTDYPDEGYYCLITLPDRLESAEGSMAKTIVINPSLDQKDPTVDSGNSYTVVNTSVTGTDYSLLKPIPLFLMIGVAGVVLKRKKH